MLRVLLLLLLSSNGSSEVLPLQEAFERALRLHKSGDSENALRAYHEVIANSAAGTLTTKAMTMALTNAASLEVSVGDENRASELFAKASALNPTSQTLGNECVFWADRDPGRGMSACRRARDLGHSGAAALLEEDVTPLRVKDIEERWPRLRRLFDDEDEPPYVWIWEKALDVESCMSLVHYGDSVGWTASKTQGEASSWRHSETVYVPWEALEMVPVLQALGIDLRNYSETPQLVSYPPNGYFNIHSDATGYLRRDMTALFYLDNSTCATIFPYAPSMTGTDAGLEVYPTAGDALVFVNVDLQTRSEVDTSAMHVSLPPFCLEVFNLFSFFRLRSLVHRAASTSLTYGSGFLRLHNQSLRCRTT